jgi:hypothetical protein
MGFRSIGDVPLKTVWKRRMCEPDLSHSTLVLAFSACQVAPRRRVATQCSTLMVRIVIPICTSKVHRVSCYSSLPGQWSSHRSSLHPMTWSQVTRKALALAPLYGCLIGRQTYNPCTAEVVEELLRCCKPRNKPIPNNTCMEKEVSLSYRPVTAVGPGGASFDACNKRGTGKQGPKLHE